MFELQKKIAWASLKSGIVISVALVLLFVAIFFSGNISIIFSPKILINAKIPNIQGLRAGAPVWLFGVEIGKVKNLILTDSGIMVTISLDKKHSKSIYKNTTASVMTMGILGDKFIELKQGNAKSPPIAQGDTISGTSAIEFGQITSAAVSALTKMDSVVLQLSELFSYIIQSTGSFSQLLNDPTLYKQLSLSAKNLSNLTGNLLSSEGTVKSLIENPDLYDNLNNAAEQMVSIMNRIDHGFGNGGMASAIVNDSTMATNLRDAIASMKETTRSINDLVIDIKNNPKKYLSIKIF